MHYKIFDTNLLISCLFLKPVTFYDEGFFDNTCAMLNTSDLYPLQSFFFSSSLLSEYSGDPGEYDGDPGEYCGEVGEY